MIKVTATENAKWVVVDIEDIVMTPNSRAPRSIMLGPVVSRMAVTAYTTIKTSNHSDKSIAIEKRVYQSFEVIKGCCSCVSSLPSPIQVHTFPAKMPTNSTMKHPSISNLKIIVTRINPVVVIMNFS